MLLWIIWLFYENRYVIRRLIEIKTRFVIDYVVHKSINYEHEIYCVV